MSKMYQKLGAKGAFASTVNNKNLGCDTNSTIPSGGAGLSGSAQHSGKTIHSRTSGMNVAGSDGSLKGMPTVHSGSGTDTRGVTSSLKGMPTAHTR